MDDLDDNNESNNTKIDNLSNNNNIIRNGLQESKYIYCPNCNEPQLKPATVLYGSPLPKVFFDNVSDDATHADLLIIIGTCYAMHMYTYTPIVNL